MCVNLSARGHQKMWPSLGAKFRDNLKFLKFPIRCGWRPALVAGPKPRLHRRRAGTGPLAGCSATAPPPKKRYKGAQTKQREEEERVSHSESRTVSQSRVRSGRARKLTLVRCFAIVALCFFLKIKIWLFHSLLCSRKTVGTEVQPAGLRRGPRRRPRLFGHSVARKFSFLRFRLIKTLMVSTTPENLNALSLTVPEIFKRE